MKGTVSQRGVAWTSRTVAAIVLSVLYIAVEDTPLEQAVAAE